MTTSKGANHVAREHGTPPVLGLIVNDSKPRALAATEMLAQRFVKAGWGVERTASAGGLVGFASPEGPLRGIRYDSCVPGNFHPGITMAIVLGGGRHRALRRPTDGAHRRPHAGCQHRPHGFSGGGLSP